MKLYLDILERLRTFKSRLDKVTYLKEVLKDETFVQIVKYAVDPWITFGIKDYIVDDHAVDEPPMELFHLLSQLSTRQWTGNRAREKAGLFANQSQENARLLDIILGKDLRAGIGAKILNQAYPGLIREFQISAGETFDPKKAVYPLLESIKVDGFRCIALCYNEERIEFLSRNGKPLEVSRKIALQIMRLYRTIKTSFVLDGELKVGGFNYTASVVSKKSGDKSELQYHVFDYIPLDLFLCQGETLTQIERYTLLRDLLQGYYPVNLLQHGVVNNYQEARAVFNTYRKLGHEGVMFKKPDSPYAYRKTYDWMKMKDSDTIDANVLRMEEGEGKYQGMMGALIIDYKGKEVNVGSGYSDQERIDFWRSMPEMIEVSFHEETEDGSLRHPVYERVRVDKT